MTDLITLAEYKDISGKVNDKDDTLISATLPGVSSYIRSYCNRSFTEYFATNKTEYFSFEWAGEVVFLNETPIVELVSVSERDNPSESYTTLTTNTDFVLDSRLDAIFRLNGSGGRKYFCKGIDAVKVEYKAGFENLPDDLKLATVDLVNYYMRDEYKTEKTNISFTVKTPGTSSSFNNGNLPDHIRRVLDMYRNNV